MLGISVPEATVDRVGAGGETAPKVDASGFTHMSTVSSLVLVTLKLYRQTMKMVWPSTKLFAAHTIGAEPVLYTPRLNWPGIVLVRGISRANCKPVFVEFAKLAIKL